jgi:anti-anti-sigma factor
MEVSASERGGVVVLEPKGAVDTRGAFDFERTALARLDAGARYIAVDFARVDLITSAGLRVLVMLAKRLQALGGGLVLCRLNEQVRTVLEIAGLLSQFQVADTPDEAAGRLAEAAAGASMPRGSRVSRLAARLLGEEPMRAVASASGPSRRPSALAELIAELLSGRSGSAQGADRRGR